jgi:hypothetical protein
MLHFLEQLLSILFPRLASFMLVKHNWPSIVQHLLWVYKVSCNENPVFLVIINNFVVTQPIGTYWKKFQMHIL